MPDKPRRRLRTFLVAAALLLAALYAVSLPLLRAQVRKAAEETLGVPVEVGLVTYNPFAGSATVHGIVVHNPPGFDGRLASAGRIHADLALSSLFGGAIRLQRLALDDAEVAVVLSKDGTVNLEPVLKKLSGEDAAPAAAKGRAPSAPAVEKKKMHIVLEHVTGRRLRAVLRDYGRGNPCAELALEDGTLEATDLHVNDGAEGMPGKVSFAAGVRGPEGSAPARATAAVGVLGDKIDFDASGTIRNFDIRTVEAYTTGAIGKLMAGGYRLDIAFAGKSRASVLEDASVTVKTEGGETYRVALSGPLGRPKVDGDSILMNAFALPFQRIFAAGSWVVGLGGEAIGLARDAVRGVGGVLEDAGQALKGAFEGIFGGGKKDKDR